MKFLKGNGFKIGAGLWFLSLQYFLVQLIVAHAWASPYSINANTISDLGNTSCNLYGIRYVCSPESWLMNLSFFILGLTTIMGSFLLYQRFKSNNKILIGFSLMAVNGFGTMVVGLSPENHGSVLHGAGAGTALLLGNVAVLILGYGLNLPIVLKIYSLMAGLFGLFALLLFVNHYYDSFGIGGMERFSAYPQTIWLILVGGYFLLKIFKVPGFEKRSIEIKDNATIEIDSDTNELSDYELS